MTVISPGTAAYWYGWAVITVVLGVLYVVARAAVMRYVSRGKEPVGYFAAVLAVLRSRWTVVVVAAIFAVGALSSKDADQTMFLYADSPVTRPNEKLKAVVECDRVPVVKVSGGCSFTIRTAKTTDPPQNIPDEDHGWNGVDPAHPIIVGSGATARVNVTAPTAEVVFVPADPPAPLDLTRATISQRFLLAWSDEGHQSAAITLALRGVDAAGKPLPLAYRTIDVTVQSNSSLLAWIGANFDSVKTIGVAILGAFGLFGATKSVAKPDQISLTASSSPEFSRAQRSERERDTVTADRDTARDRDSTG